MCRSRSSRCIPTMRGASACTRLRPRRDRARRRRLQGCARAKASSAARCSCRSTGAARPPPSARVGELVAPHTDPFSGQPEAKATPAAIAPVDVRLSRLRADARAGRAAARAPGGRASPLAGGDRHAASPPTKGRSAGAIALRRCCGGELAEFIDLQRGIYRAAAFRDGRLDGCAVPRPGRRRAAMGRRQGRCSTPKRSPTSQRRMLLSGAHG